jgi:hypothetical protein
MPDTALTRRHVLAGAAATVAAAALPAVAVAAGEPSAVGYSAFDIDIHDTPAWAEAVRSAWLGYGGKLTAFGDMFPHLQAILDGLLVEESA